MFFCNKNSNLDNTKRIIKNNKTILENFSYITLLQIVVLLAPFITYPYLSRVLGMELYGLVLSAQMLSSYATIIVKFGFDSVSARHISINRDSKEKLSEIMSSILTMRGGLWIISFILYMIVVLIVPIYREHFLLFLFSFGLTLNVLLFPQFFFQGIEKMKYITFISVGIQVLFVVLTFFVIKEPSDYMFVPVLHSVGYLVGGGASLYMIFHDYKLSFFLPRRAQAILYFKDALPLFATDTVATVKDKFNYLLLGVCVGMGEVVPYDISSKLCAVIIQPLMILNTVIFPKMARERNNHQFIKIGLVIFITIAVLLLMVNLFLHTIVHFLAGKEVDLFPIRVYLLSALFLSIGSYISSSLIVARGYNKYMFYSIVVTTSFYLLLLATLYYMNMLDTIMAFVGLTVFSYLVEMIYRVFVAKKIIKSEIVVEK